MERRRIDWIESYTLGNWPHSRTSIKNEALMSAHNLYLRTRIERIVASDTRDLEWRGISICYNISLISELSVCLDHKFTLLQPRSMSSSTRTSPAHAAPSLLDQNRLVLLLAQLEHNEAPSNNVALLQFACVRLSGNPLAVELDRPCLDRSARLSCRCHMSAMSGDVQSRGQAGRTLGRDETACDQDFFKGLADDV